MIKYCWRIFFSLKFEFTIGGPNEEKNCMKPPSFNVLQMFHLLIHTKVNGTVNTCLRLQRNAPTPNKASISHS